MRARGTASVELILSMPIMILLLGAIPFFWGGYVTSIGARHEADRQTWSVAMSNQMGQCGTATPGRFYAVSLGQIGDRAKALGMETMRDFSFWYDLGGVRRDVTRAIPSPPESLRNSKWTKVQQSDYLPCNEVIGADDGELPSQFASIWQQYVGPKN